MSRKIGPEREEAKEELADYIRSAWLTDDTESVHDALERAWTHGVFNGDDTEFFRFLEKIGEELAKITERLKKHSKAMALLSTNFFSDELPDEDDFTCAPPDEDDFSRAPEEEPVWHPQR